MSDKTDAGEAIAVFQEAAELLREDPVRRHAQLVFPDYGQLVVTGDLHGHRRNFDKLVKYCGLGTAPSRSVLLQEIIHEDLVKKDQADLSHELLLVAAKWKCEYPDQVFFIQSNHEVCQLTERGITKGGTSVLESFEAGVEMTFGADDTPRILDAINELILSYPLAARTANSVFIAHSLPAQREMSAFDPSVLDRDITLEDLDDGPAAKFLWGRRHKPELIEELAGMLDAELFILGHQPEPEGYRQEGERVLILASDHNHGVFVPIDLSKPVTMELLLKRIRKFVSVP